MKVVQAIDNSGFSIPCFLNDKKLLKSVGLRRRDVTPEVLAKVRLEEHRSTEALKRKVWNLDGTWNGEMDPILRMQQRNSEEEKKGYKILGFSNPKQKGTDKWGYRKGTQVSMVNKVLSEKWKSLDRIAEESGVRKNLCYQHIKTLVKKGLVMYNQTMKAAKVTGKKPKTRRKKGT